MFDYNSFKNAVIEANAELYGYINTHMSESDLEKSNTIGYGGDNSLVIDLVAEEIFIKHLCSFGDIFSEEVGLLSSNSNVKIIIDPLDGSHNFSSYLPYYGTSVALKIDGETKAGFVTNLITATITYRILDENTKKVNILNKKELKIPEVKEPELAIFERAYAYPKICKKLAQKKIKVRSPGAAALSLCDAKNYKFVIFAGKIREFDIAASLYINSNLFIHKDDEFLIMTKNNYYLSLIKEIIKDI